MLRSDQLLMGELICEHICMFRTQGWLRRNPRRRFEIIISWDLFMFGASTRLSHMLTGSNSPLNDGKDPKFIKIIHESGTVRRIC